MINFKLKNDQLGTNKYEAFRKLIQKGKRLRNVQPASPLVRYPIPILNYELTTTYKSEVRIQN